MGAAELARPLRWPHRGWRGFLLALAFAVGLVFSFPNWWWQFTSDEYSLVRGYVLSDDDFAPYAAALSDASSYGLPPLTAFHRSYETRDRFFYPALTLWLTHLALGAAVRLLGSLELLAPVGLFFSGAATFLLFYALARRLVPARAAALLIALFACFRYPFYISLLAAGRRLVQAAGHADPASLLRVAFPGMVNGFVLYPYLRWPVPGMVFGWFLLALLLLAWLVRRLWNGARPRRLAWAILGLGTLIGLSAYVYFFFWSFLLVALALLALVALLAQRTRLAAALAGVGLVAAAWSAPFWLAAAGPLSRVAAQAASAASPPGGVLPDADTLLVALSTHGLLAFAVVLSPGPGRSDSDDRRALLFCLHLAIVLLAAVELMGFRSLQAWHWAAYVMDCLIPVTAGWLIAGQFGRPAGPPPRWAFGVSGIAVVLAAFVGVAVAGPWVYSAAPSAAALRTVAALTLLVPAMVALRSRPGRWPVALAALALSLLIWYAYHRTVSELSWLAFLPLGLWLAGRRPRLLLAGAAAFTGLNLLLALGLQFAVRPTAARPFFSQPVEYSDALRWLDANTPPESVVTTGGWLGDNLVRGYTHNLTLAQPHWWTSVPAAERQRRQLVRAAIFQTPPELLAQWAADRPQIVRDFKAKVNEEWIGDRSMDFLTEQQAALAYDADAYLALVSQPLGQLLTEYRVDYVWVGPWERYAGRRDFGGAPELELVYQNDLVQIYQVRREALP